VAYFFGATLYINELADVLSEYKVTVKKFADDLQLYAVLATDIVTVILH